MAIVSPLAGGEELVVGAEGEQVGELQWRLQHLGYYEGVVDERYGDATELAVRAFQRAHSRPEDGRTDSETWEMLGREAQPVADDQYAQSDQGQSVQVGGLSDDGAWQWDGVEWRAVAGDAAASASTGVSSVGQLSPDGQWRWDGADWQAVVGFDGGAPAAQQGSLLGVELEHAGRDGKPATVAGKLSKAEARKLVTPDIRPKECFITYRGTEHGWDAISGTGCAHWVAHERGMTGKTDVCEAHYLIRVNDVIGALKQLSPDLRGAVVGAVWRMPTGSHIGIVRAVNRDEKNRIVSVEVENDSSDFGGVVTQTKFDGSIWN